MRPTRIAFLSVIFVLLMVNFTFAQSDEPPPGKWTVLVHGAVGGDWTTYEEIQELWMDEAARSISALCPIPAEIHTFNRDDFSNPNFEYFNFPTDRHNILLFEWTENADGDFFDNKDDKDITATDGYAFAAGDALYTLLKHWGISSDVFALIGHSRGSVVISETTRRLIFDQTPPQQVVYLDGEGGNIHNLGYKDATFEAWETPSGFTNIRFDNIYSTVNEWSWTESYDPRVPPVQYGCYYNPTPVNYGGHEKPGCNNYNVGLNYRHGFCDSFDMRLQGGGEVPPPIWEYLIDDLGVNDEFDDRIQFYDGYFQFMNSTFSNPVSPPKDPYENEAWNSLDPDRPHFSDKNLFNGDFEWESRAGWKSHGGAGDADFDSREGHGYVLKLDEANQVFKHSFFWIPENAKFISYFYSVDFSFWDWTKESDDRFVVTISNNETEDSYDLDISSELPWTKQFIPLADYEGSLCRIEFKTIPVGNWDSPRIRIDDVGITNKAKSVELAPNIVLSIDRSGSMSDGFYEPGVFYLEDARNAASNFVEHLRTGDRIGVSSFAGDATQVFQLQTIDDHLIINNAQSAIQTIWDHVWNGTSIGAGLSRSQNMLSVDGDPDAPWAIVLLSDGDEVTAPYVHNVLPTIPDKTDVYTISLGNYTNESLMNNIAAYTDGQFFAAPDPNNLEAIYTAIRGQLSGQQTVLSQTGYINQGETHLIGPINLDDGIGAGTFSVTWEGSDIDLSLIAPDGTEFTSAAATDNPSIVFSESARHEYFTIYNPMYGEWTMRVYGAEIPQGGESFTCAVQVDGALDLAVGFGEDQHVVCQPILVTASLVDGLEPILGAQVTATVASPTLLVTEEHRGIVGMAELEETQLEFLPGISLASASNSGPNFITLYDDGLHGDGQADDGVYAANYNHTTAPGSYSFNVTAMGNSWDYGDYQRQDLASTVVVNGATPPPTASFHVESTMGYAPFTVQFNDLSSGCIAQWNWDFGDENTSNEPSPVHTFETPGEYEVVLSILGPGGFANHGVTIVVESMTDIIPPTITVHPEPLSLWPPNHKYRTVDIIDQILEVADDSDQNVSIDDVVIVSVTSDEEEDSDGTGDGETFDDIIIDEDCRSVELRAERQGGGNGRVYTINLAVADSTGNIGTSTVMAYVGHDMSIGTVDLDGDPILTSGSTRANTTVLIAAVPTDDGVHYQVRGCEPEVPADDSTVEDGLGLELKTKPLPSQFALLQNHPNPFNPTTTISFDLPRSTRVDLKVYDISGRLVRTLIRGENYSAGRGEAVWRGVDGSGRPVAAGVYFYHLIAGSFEQTNRMVLLK